MFLGIIYQEHLSWYSTRMSIEEQITLTVIAGTVPECIQGYSKEECTLLLQIGCDAIESLRTHKLRIENPAQERAIQELKQRLETQSSHYGDMMEEYKKRMQAQCSEQYQERLANKDRYIDELKEMLSDQKNKVAAVERTVQLESKKLYEAESAGKIEHLTRSLEKLDQEVTKVQEMYMSQIKQKSMGQIGDIGENIYFDLASESFRFFPEFDIINVANEPTKGDFHMHFKDFHVLVDVKNWDNMVTNSEREKLHRDLLCNDMKFAWMVSLKSNIRKYDNFPISVEWISKDKCILYLNSVLKHHNPADFLRLAWNFCNMMQQLGDTGASSEASVNEDLTKICGMLRTLENVVKEESTTMNEMTKNVDILVKNMEKLKVSNQTVKDMIKECLSTKSTELLNNMSCKKFARKPRAKKAVASDSLV